MAQPEVIKDIEARVKKSGDTMTGLLKTNGSIENQGEARFSHPTYCPNIEDTAVGIGCAFKASRGHFNQMNVNEIYLPATATTNYESNKILFKSYSGENNGTYTGVSEIAQINTTGLKVGSSSIGINGYIEGTWLRTTGAGNKAGDFAIIDNLGWIYKRTPAQVLSDIGAASKSHNHNSEYVKKTGDTMTGNLTAPTFVGTLNGNASSADKLNTNAGGLRQPIYFNGGKPVVAADDYVFYDEVSGAPSGDSSSPFVLKIGDTMTGNLTAPNFIGNLIGNANTATSANTANTATSANTANTATKATYATNANNVNIVDDTSLKLYVLGATTTGNTRIYRESSVYMSSNVLYGAAWNDYAEYRQSDITQPGKCIIENGDDTLSLSIERLQRGAEIVSDTFGFAIGETDDCKTPIAASGRVLAYPFEDREEFKSHIGYPVCSGPNGTVSIMTDEEEQLYPSRIIGYVSAVPDYETWGTGNVKVNGRIWIRIK